MEPNINPAVVHPQVSHIGHLVDDGAMVNVSHRAHTFKYKSLNSHWHYHEDDAIEPNP